jgi:hypothetical protein
MLPQARIQKDLPEPSELVMSLIAYMLASRLRLNQFQGRPRWFDRQILDERRQDAALVGKMVLQAQHCRSDSRLRLACVR